MQTRQRRTTTSTTITNHIHSVGAPSAFSELRLAINHELATSIVSIWPLWHYTMMAPRSLRRYQSDCTASLVWALEQHWDADDFARQTDINRRSAATVANSQATLLSIRIHAQSRSIGAHSWALIEHEQCSCCSFYAVSIINRSIVVDCPIQSASLPTEELKMLWPTQPALQPANRGSRWIA